MFVVKSIFVCCVKDVRRVSCICFYLDDIRTGHDQELLPYIVPSAEYLSVQ